jgi:hypothetical protein
MDTLRNAIQTVIGLTLAVASFAIMAALGLAFVGIVLVVGLSTALALKMFGSNQARPVMARTQNARRNREPRIWNDGRGTIIDQ